MKTIGIIGGTGKLGRVFDSALSSVGYTVRVSDENSDPKQTERVISCDWVIVCVPIGVTNAVLRDLSLKIKPHQTLTDFTSVKTPLVNEFGLFQGNVVPCHPIFGPMENVSGQNIIVIRYGKSPDTEKVIHAFKKIGLRVTELASCEEHDRYMSIIQSLTHFMHIAFTTALRHENPELDKILQLCSPVYRSNFAFACRISGRDPDLYSRILMDNPYSEKTLKNFLKHAGDILSDVLNGDHAEFDKKFDANKTFLKDYLPKFNAESEYLVEMLTKRTSEEK